MKGYWWKHFNRCPPWAHRWRVTRVSVPMFDPSARGILKECLDCEKVIAK